MARNFVADALKFECSFQLSYRISNVAEVMSAPAAKRIGVPDLCDGWRLDLPTKQDSDDIYFGLFLALPQKRMGTTVVVHAELRQLDGQLLKLWNPTLKFFGSSSSWGCEKLISKSTLLDQNARVKKDNSFLLILNLHTLQAQVDATPPQLSSIPASEAINASLISPSDERDLKFLSFNTRPTQNLGSHIKEAFASSRFLATRTNYFSSHAAFAEGADVMEDNFDVMPKFEDSFDYLSDSDLESDDEDEAMGVDDRSSHGSDKSGMVQSSEDKKKWKVIIIGDIAHRTWVATLGFLHTNVIRFAPLSVKEGTPNEAYTKQERVAFPEASCKSIFRVADKMGIKDLEDHAFNFLKSQMDDDTIFHELFSPFTARYDRLKDMECEYLFANWSRLKASAILKTKLDEVAMGKRPESLWLLPRVFVNPA